MPGEELATHPTVTLRGKPDGATLLATVACAVTLCWLVPKLAPIDPPAASGGPWPSWLSQRVVTLKAPGPTMIRIPAGTLAMGSTLKGVMYAAELCQRGAPTEACRPQHFADEQPLHTVELSAYWLDRTEVTVAQYKRCVEQRRCTSPPYVDGATRFERDDYPVSLVGWEDAKRYCTWRGARLPTEAEFERASRGASGRLFPWGDLYNSHVANHGRFGVADTDDTDGFDELAPVASYPAGRTPDGFMDLAGNVSEWVFDLYQSRYPEQTLKDPTGPPASAQHTERVTRGGHFKSAPVWLRGAARESHPPGTRLPYLGFRCAQTRP